jgi:ectoine hydroxylase-related dioxygenase (phytanoyl-CoA dioxygenase family)
LIRSLVALGLENNFRVVRAVYLDKHKDANWKVAWHQDLTIAVRERKEVDGYGPWSLKAGIPHVQPPVSVLERMLAVRIHLDDADETNGALRVIPGSHLQGRLSAVEVQRLTKETAPVTCPMKRGDVMLLRPLLLHASSVASDPAHRRVLHFEYATGELNGGLQWYEMSDAPTN